MKCVKTFALTLLVSVLATTAHAGVGKLSRFQCGIHFGGTSKIHKEYSESKQNRRFGTKRVVRLIDSTESGVTTFTAATSKPTERGRMPPAFTFAKVRCSW
jgi:hypothetical protein